MYSVNASSRHLRTPSECESISQTTIGRSKWNCFVDRRKVLSRGDEIWGPDASTLPEFAADGCEFCLHSSIRKSYSKMATSKRWVLITGVSEGGLGDALVLELLEHGLYVIATALQLNLLSYMPQKNPQLRLLELDVTSSESIKSATSEVRRITDGRLDFLVNNAGYGYHMPLMDATIENVKKNFDVNVFGVLEVTQAFFPMLREAKGVILNQASIAGLPAVYQPYIGCYSSTKAALISLSNTMRIEMEPFEIKVGTDRI